jgi:hypothetical protein
LSVLQSAFSLDKIAAAHTHTHAQMMHDDVGGCWQSSCMKYETKNSVQNLMSGRRKRENKLYSAL